MINLTWDELSPAQQQIIRVGREKGFPLMRNGTEWIGWYVRK